MKKIKNLNRYQKCVLILMMAMVLVFAVIYPVTIQRVGFAWFGAVFICILNAFSILFADELFRWCLAFRIRNADHAEPSDWEIAGRYIGWTVLPIMALALFLMGLQ